MNRFQALRQADPEVFVIGYSRWVQQRHQPILVTANGQPIDQQQYEFIGDSIEYRGHYYASINPQFPIVRLVHQHNNTYGLAMPACRSN